MKLKFAAVALAALFLVPTGASAAPSGLAAAKASVSGLTETVGCRNDGIPGNCRFRGRRGGGTTIIEQSPGIDLTTMLLLGGLGGGGLTSMASGGAGLGILPFLALSGMLEPQTTVIRERRRGRR